MVPSKGQMTPEEFIRVYLPLGDGLYRVAFRLLGKREEAEDAVQDLYVKIWNSLDGLDRVDNPEAWCLVVLRNLCIDRLRTKGAQRAVRAGEELPDEVPPEQSGRLEQTLSAVRSLPARSRELLHLRLVEDLSYAEISRETGLSENALRVTFHRIKQQLKKKI